jgi:uncharacterized protein YgiM (DUF1202 family)
MLNESLINVFRETMQMSNKLIGLCLGISFGLNLAGFSSPALAETETCIVTDPTGTALNVRKSPNGKVIGSIQNDKNVKILGISIDKKGRAWAKVRGNAGSTGWILRDFVTCS